MTTEEVIEVIKHTKYPALTVLGAFHRAKVDVSTCVIYYFRPREDSDSCEDSDLDVPELDTLFGWKKFLAEIGIRRYRENIQN